MRSINVLMTILQIGGSMPYSGRLPHDPLSRSWRFTTWCFFRTALYLAFHAATLSSSWTIFDRSGVGVLAQSMMRYVVRILMQVTALLMLASSKKLAVVLSRLGDLQIRQRTQVFTSAKDPLVIIMLATFSFLYVAVVAKTIHETYAEASSGEGAWVYRLPAIGSWVCGGFTMLSVPATLSLVIKYFILFVRCTVPPWAQIILEQNDGETLKMRTCASPYEVHRTSLLDLPEVVSSQTLHPRDTARCVLCQSSLRLGQRTTRGRLRRTSPFLAWSKPAKNLPLQQGDFPPTKPHMEMFFSNVQDLLIQTDEIFYMFTDYIGPILLVWTLLTAVSFTFALYLLVDAALKGQALWDYCLFATVVFLTFLLINVSADNINQEVGACKMVKLMYCYSIRHQMECVLYDFNS